MDFKYKETYYIRTNDLSFNRHLSPMAIQTYLEEAATKHALKVGVGYDDSADNGYFWVLRSSKYTMKRIPEGYNLVDVVTWPAGLDRAKALRRHELYIGNELIGEALSYWLMIDLKTRRPIVADHYRKLYNQFDIPKTDFFKLPKIKTPTEMTFAYNKVIMQRDIDWNGHLNNVRYVDVLYNAIPYEILKQKQIMELQLDYLKECRLGASIDLYYALEDHYIYIKGVNEDVVSFNAKLRFE